MFKGQMLRHTHIRDMYPSPCNKGYKHPIFGEELPIYMLQAEGRSIVLHRSLTSLPLFIISDNVMA